MNTKYKGNGFDIFRSKRFLTALAGIITMILTSFFPELDIQQEQIAALAGLLIVGYSVQDAIVAGKKQVIAPAPAELVVSPQKESTT